MLNVGDRVRSLIQVRQPASDETPESICCEVYDELVVRRIDRESRYPIKVSHSHVIGRDFGVDEFEVEKIDD